MKFLTDRQEIARAINGREFPVININLADTDEYGVVGETILIDNGTFRDGFPYMIEADIRLYADTKKWTIGQGCIGIHKEFGYTDVMKMATRRNAPVIKADEDIILIINNPVKRICYVAQVHTGKRIDPHCIEPLTIVDNDCIFNAEVLRQGKEIYGKKFLGEEA